MKVTAASGLALAIMATAYVVLSDTSTGKRAASAAASPSVDDAAKRTVEAQPLTSGGAAHSPASSADSSIRHDALALPAYLPAEQRLLSNDGIIVDAVDRQLEDPRFKPFLEQFERDAAGDALATQLTNSARTQIEQQLRAGSQRLDRFACGLTLCVGSIRAASGADTDWWQHLGDGKEVKVYAFLDARVALGSQEAEQRFVFSIDPRVKGLVGAANLGKH